MLAADSEIIDREITWNHLVGLSDYDDSVNKMEKLVDNIIS